MDEKEMRILPHKHPAVRGLRDISWLIRRALPWWIKRPYDWVADRVWRRFHILKLSYGYGWVDSDTKMLYALFDILTEFMEKERPGEVVDWAAQEDTKTAWAEIQALYKWWKGDRPARKDPLNDIKYPGREEGPPILGKDGKITGYLMGPYKGSPKEIEAWKAACDESGRLEMIWDEEDSFMMARLIKIRQHLWT